MTNENDSGDVTEFSSKFVVSAEELRKGEFATLDDVQERLRENSE